MTTKVNANKHLADLRILEVMDFVVTNKINSIKNETQFLKSIGYNNTTNLQLIKNQIQSFQIEHLQNVCTVYNINADFLLNANCSKMMRDLGNETPLFRLKVVTKELAMYIKGLSYL